MPELPGLIRLHGTRVLVAGATGAGKASLLWGLVRAMFPLMQDGLVRVLAADPKLMGSPDAAVLVRRAINVQLARVARGQPRLLQSTWTGRSAAYTGIAALLPKLIVRPHGPRASALRAA